MVLVGATLYVFYDRAVMFVDTVPQYTDKIRRAIEPVTNKIQRLQENTQKLSPAAPTKKLPEVRISETPSWPSYLARGVGSVGGAIIIAGVVPFLMFFMLVREHICDWLCTTFGVGYGEGLDYCWPCR